MVILFTLINLFVTWWFNADVTQQGGAYATGVLVLMSSAALAVAISSWRRVARWAPFFAIAVVFFYTTVTNMVERPDNLGAWPVLLGEAIPGKAVPILAWYPQGDRMGRQFIYPR